MVDTVEEVMAVGETEQVSAPPKPSEQVAEDVAAVQDASLGAEKESAKEEEMPLATSATPTEVAPEETSGESPATIAQVVAEEEVKAVEKVVEAEVDLSGYQMPSLYQPPAERHEEPAVDTTTTMRENKPRTFLKGTNIVEVELDRGETEKVDLTEDASEQSEEEEDASSSESSGAEEEGAEEEEEMEDEEDGPVHVGPLRTANEQVEEGPTAPLPFEVVPDRLSLVRAGTIETLLHVTPETVKGMTILAPAYPTFILDSGSLLALESRKAIGCIEEPFGPVAQPRYLIRFAEVKQASDFTLGQAVFAVEEMDAKVNQDALKAQKGSDASNLYDEEVGESEREFSDDEAEAEAAQLRKRKRIIEYHFLLLFEKEQETRTSNDRKHGEAGLREMNEKAAQKARTKRQKRLDKQQQQQQTEPAAPRPAPPPPQAAPTLDYDDDGPPAGGAPDPLQQLAALSRSYKDVSQPSAVAPIASPSTLLPFLPAVASAIQQSLPPVQQQQQPLQQMSPMSFPPQQSYPPPQQGGGYPPFAHQTYSPYPQFSMYGQPSPQQQQQGGAPTQYPQLSCHGQQWQQGYPPQGAMPPVYMGMNLQHSIPLNGPPRPAGPPYRPQ